MTSSTTLTFADLGLAQPVFDAVEKAGYETPSAIQAQTIPILLQGRDVLGQAQTGTGKTAAFALPILSRLDLAQKSPQVLVLAPTRELALQVSEAFKQYAAFIKGINIVPIYGGQDYRTQINALKKSVHVVVGTPGRVMDHMRRGTLVLDQLKTLVLDEADEMLRMGFIEDVEWVLEHSPEQRQIALFSATMPEQIRKITNRYLNEPEHITIKVKTSTAETIRQRFLPVRRGVDKLDAITRLLEVEPCDATIVFVRTRNSTTDLAEQLEQRGHRAAALNGDIPQQRREKIIEQLKNGRIDIVVATDVAARGLDVERISHVINYDIPYDVEAYIHRIGRTGRAGREGDAILFTVPRDQRMLGIIERTTKKKIDRMALPTVDEVNKKRIAQFTGRIEKALENEDLSLYAELLKDFQKEKDVPPLKIAAAIAHLLQGKRPFLMKEPPKRERNTDNKRPNNKPGQERGPRRQREDNGPEKGMRRYRLGIGRVDNVQPGNIVGAIANEAGIEPQYIGNIRIFDDHSWVDLPDGMPKHIYNTLKKTWVMGKKMNISPLKDKGEKKTFAGKNKSFKQRKDNDRRPKKRR